MISAPSIRGGRLVQSAVCSTIGALCGDTLLELSWAACAHDRASSGVHAGTSGAVPSCARAGSRSFHSSSANAAANPAMGSSVNRREAAKFAELADKWWDLNGPFRPLHQLNPTRCAFIRSALCDNFGLDAAAPAPLAGLRVLDVGCGGGLLSEALARMGADVDGIDVNPEGIAAAQAHAALDPGMAGRLHYKAVTLEGTVAGKGAGRYDAVIASEVIEHVASVSGFCASLVEAAAPGGAIVISTINRTPQAFALAVVAAEYVLRWVPAGTHDWSKFVQPEEVAMAMEAAGEVALRQVAGMGYNPLTGQWSLGKDTGINYIAYFQKEKPAQEGGQ